MDEKTYTYHYCAQAQIAPNKIMNIDGIITIQHKVKTMADYHEFKKVIAKNNVNYKKLVIVSLSLI